MAQKFARRFAARDETMKEHRAPQAETKPKRSDNKVQEYPMRERIYLPIVRFGVPHTDWKYVFIITLTGFILPFLLGLTIFGIPAPMFTGLGTLGITVAFFNFVRMGRRPYWFQHRLRASLSTHHHRRALPQDDLNESWLLK